MIGWWLQEPLLKEQLCYIKRVPEKSMLAVLMLFLGMQIISTSFFFDSSVHYILLRGNTL